MQRFLTGPETERLEYRAFTIDDAEAFLELNGNPEVRRYTGEPMVASLAAAKEAIKNHTDFDVIGYGRWACVLKDTSAIIGFCGLKYLSDWDAVDVGYRFLPQYWGRGLATEAYTASLDFGFGTLGLERIIGLVIPENAASIRVLEKAGMRFEAEVIYDGTPVLQFVKCRGDRCLELLEMLHRGRGMQENAAVSLLHFSSRTIHSITRDSKSQQLGCVYLSLRDHW
ncbi:MAG: GNAT family N-acetyltransferase [Planctomycetaceae bacterium]|nr:GNAT family N-acetyltransferase [Planctomycetaceae bacterium]